MYFVYSQRALAWAGQRLGTCNGITIGSDGCFVTAMCQVATHYEHPINPSQLDNQLTNRGWYVKGCQMMWNNLTKVFPDILSVQRYDWPNAADLSKLVMADDEEMIVGLDNLNQGKEARHFARVYDYNPRTGVLMIDDPWWGMTLNFASRYGSPARNVMCAFRYRKPGWVPPWKRVAARPVPIPAPVPVLPPLPATPAADPRDQKIADLTAQVAERDARIVAAKTALG